MNFWNGLLIFVLGCMVGAFVGILIIAMCQVAASADRRIEKMALERYEREKEEDSQGS
jgi:ABC-type lipoprotein release transport system permease subunit